MLLLGYIRSGVKKILDSAKKFSDNATNFSKQKQTQHFKSLKTTLENIKKTIPESQNNYAKAFDLVAEYLQEQITKG